MLPKPRDKQATLSRPLPTKRLAEPAGRLPANQCIVSCLRRRACRASTCGAEAPTVRHRIGFGAATHGGGVKVGAEAAAELWCSGIHSSMQFAISGHGICEGWKAYEDARAIAFRTDGLARDEMGAITELWVL